MRNSTPARLYALVFGAVLLTAAIVSFFYVPAFRHGEPTRKVVFGILNGNDVHNVVHCATGALGLLAFAAGAYAARTYALAAGAFYVAVAVWGFILGEGESILSTVRVYTQDSVLHLLIGVAGLAAAAAKPLPLKLPATGRRR